MNVGCDFHGDALADLELGRLSVERAREVEDHLAACQECRASLPTIQAVRANAVQVPEGLESRIRDAVGRSSGRVPSRVPSRSWAALLAAAAALAVVWLGVGRDPGIAPEAVPDTGAEAMVEGHQPYGSFPAWDGVVAGDPVLSDLSVEELERLLEEMES